jgi:hypothetical protein
VTTILVANTAVRGGDLNREVHVAGNGVISVDALPKVGQFRSVKSRSLSSPSFFALLQKNVLDQKTGTSREQLRLATVTWIEATYHRGRRPDGLGRLTPVEAGAIMSLPRESQGTSQFPTNPQGIKTSLKPVTVGGYS